MFVTGPAYADDSVTIIGNYYLERSTRVISPSVTINKDLPYDSKVRFMYLVDNITSASGAFTPTDEPFTEFRNEFQLLAGIQLPYGLFPQVGVRFSHEGDYRSHQFNAGVQWEAPDRRTNVSLQFIHQYDIVRQRQRQGFRDTLNASYLTLGASYVINPKMIGGVLLEAQVLRGYQENVYRVEQHPRKRNRYCFAPWLRYRFTETNTTVQVDYRHYRGTWDLSSNTFGVKITQQILPSLEVQPELRYHTQNGVFFVELVDNFLTADPKLRALETTRVGARLYWTMSFLSDTAL